jgi:hypothetical protein
VSFVSKELSFCAQKKRFQVVGGQPTVSVQWHLDLVDRKGKWS